MPGKGLKRANFGTAWLTLSLTFCLHVVDEALNDFLGVYNPVVSAVRERFPLLPLPRFEFGAWITGLSIAITICLAATPLAYRGNRILAPIAWVLTVVMALNAILHFTGSIYLGRWMPGVYSSPLLLAASIYLIASLIRRTERSVDSAG